MSHTVSFSRPTQAGKARVTTMMGMTYFPHGGGSLLGNVDTVITGRGPA